MQGQGLDFDDSSGSLPTQNIPWFCDSILNREPASQRALAQVTWNSHKPHLGRDLCLQCPWTNLKIQAWECKWVLLCLLCRISPMAEGSKSPWGWTIFCNKCQHVMVLMDILQNGEKMDPLSTRIYCERQWKNVPARVLSNSLPIRP